MTLRETLFDEAFDLLRSLVPCKLGGRARRTFAKSCEPRGVGEEVAQRDHRIGGLTCFNETRVVGIKHLTNIGACSGKDRPPACEV